MLPETPNNLTVSRVLSICQNTIRRHKTIQAAERRTLSPQAQLNGCFFTGRRLSVAIEGHVRFVCRVKYRHRENARQSSRSQTGIQQLCTLPLYTNCPTFSLVLLFQYFNPE